MRRISLLVLPVLFVIASTAGPSVAQVRPWEISIAGGPSFPVGDFENEASTGYNVQGSVGFDLPALPFGLRGDLIWQEFPDNSDLDDEWFTQIAGVANAVINIPLVVVEPYALVGAGLFRTGMPDVTHSGHVHSDESSTDPGVNAGIGLEFPFVGMRGFVEARYQHVFGDGDANDFQAIPVTAGIRF